MKRKRMIHAPLVGPAVSLMAGIAVMALWAGGLGSLGALGSLGQLGLLEQLGLLGLLGLLVVLTALLKRFPVVQTVMICVDFVLVGMVLVQRQPLPVAPDRQVEAVVFSEPVEKPKTMAVDLLLPESGEQVRRYLWKDENSRALHLGDGIVLRRLGEGYVARRDWYRGGDAVSEMSRLDRVRLRFLSFRQSLLARYHQTSMDDDAYGVLAAMTLGDKKALSSEVRETFSVTGASHVLALSGLHLGIIYMLLSRLFMGRRRFWPAQVAIVMGIWAFAFLTGLSTSMVRSATMISVYAVFSLGGRSRSSVNLLCFAAMVILLVSPKSLFDVGFQLSFMAVLSILLFMPFVEQFWPAENRVHRWLRGMVGVSVTAQIGVAPLIAFYFGRFSTYFLLTNFIVIPLVTLILYVALVVMLFPSLGGVLVALVDIMNRALGWVARLPCSSIDGLHPSVLTVSLLYVIVLLIYLVTSRLSSAVYRSGLQPPSEE